MNKNILEVIKEKKFNLLIPMGFDLLFLFLLGFIQSGILNKIGIYIFSIQNIMQNDPTTYKSYNLPSLSLEDSIISTYAKYIIILIALYYIILFALYIIVQGLSWYYSFNISGKKIKLTTLIKKFALANIPLLIFYIIISSYNFIKGFNNFTNDVTTSNTTLTFTSLFFVYLAFAFYSLLRKKHIFKKRLSYLFNNHKKYLTGLFAFFLLIVVNYLSSYHIILTLLIGIFVVLPGYTLLRIYLIL